MAAGITLWVRRGHKDSDEAQAFLRGHRYGADAVRDLAAQPPTPAELDALVKALGEAWPLVDPRHPSCLQWLPRGPEAAAADEVRSLLLAHPELFKAPLLLTPKGALAGFRESRWRGFLDVGKGRS